MGGCRTGTAYNRNFARMKSISTAGLAATSTTTASRPEAWKVRESCVALVTSKRES
jgi:hypothetical protein